LLRTGICGRFLEQAELLDYTTGGGIEDAGDQTFLAQPTELTDDNLSTHLSKLEAAGTSRSRRATRARNLACA
ncbi:MAG: transcriptional regulator, partial [Deltaproteobacteria bacterium]|nr:transcriptional regulator [Deltaproteobacteria bacterium]